MDERRLCFVVPAFQAEKSIAAVVRGLLDGARRAGNWTEPSVVVVDDGSTDATAERARDAGAEVLRHPVNRGKGRALLTGFRAAFDRGACAAVSVDADGQHPPEEALKIALDPAPPDALVLAVRDLLRCRDDLLRYGLDGGGRLCGPGGLAEQDHQQRKGKKKWFHRYRLLERIVWFRR